MACPAQSSRHEVERPGTTDFPGDPAMQPRGKTRRTAGVNFAGFTDKFVQEIRIQIIDFFERNVQAAAGHFAIGPAQVGGSFFSLGSHCE